VQKNFVFIEHSHLEKGNNQEEGDVSKVNEFEVGFAVMVLKYLLQQGYSYSQVTLITPYLGQLQALKKEMEKQRFSAILSDNDIMELRRLGLDPNTESSVGNKMQKIRVSTVDNYQGEQCDVIVVSLVRSNKDANIGFLSSPERVNVLLSRARHGMILIGNMGTLTFSQKGSDLWRKVRSYLQKNQFMFKGLPIRCSAHPQETTIIHNSIKMQEKASHGGCWRLCGALLSCKRHKCPQKCHPGNDPQHKHVKCMERVKIKCSQGHMVETHCHF